MARSPLFRSLRRVLGQARRGTGEADASRALTRRQFSMLAAFGASTACRTVRRSMRSGVEMSTDIAVVGGGLAGLTAAYRLQQSGRTPAVFEAATRWGGRVQTARNFSDGMFCELGAEFVDSNHAALRTLAAELGVGLSPLAGPDDGGTELYYFEGRWHAPDALLDGAGGGLFAPLAARVAADRAALLTADDAWTPRARALDDMSLAAYIASLPAAPGWVKAFLHVAYLVEYGLPTEVQSALNLVDLIGTDTQQGFEMYGDSDEAWRVAGGSSSLVEALVRRLQPTAALHREHALTGIEADGAGIHLRFDTATGPRWVSAAQVILTLPMTVLRRVEGVERLAWSPHQARALAEMAYGTHAKIMLGVQSSGLPARSNGAVITELPTQSYWMASRGQRGAVVPSREGSLTLRDRGLSSRPQIMASLLGGAAGRTERSVAIASAHRDLRRMAPDVAFDGKVVAAFWHREPWAQGSYACPLVGQYTRLYEDLATPTADGRVVLAGEHTSFEHQGYMNGAIESGERAARSVLVEAR